MIYLLIPIILFVFYALLAFVIYLFQDKFIFSPTTLTKDYLFNFNHPFEEIWITKNGLQPINALLFKVENPKGCVLYHHGNSRDLRYWAGFYELFTSRGYDVLFYDYRSFGKSKGKLSEFVLYNDARRVYNYLSKIYMNHKDLNIRMKSRLHCLTFNQDLLLISNTKNVLLSSTQFPGIFSNLTSL